MAVLCSATRCQLLPPVSNTEAKSVLPGNHFSRRVLALLPPSSAARLARVVRILLPFLAPSDNKEFKRRRCSSSLISYATIDRTYGATSSIMTDCVLSNDEIYGPLERDLGECAIGLKVVIRLDLVMGS